MSQEIPRIIQGVISLTAGVGEFTFNAQGTIDSISFKPRAPNTNLTIDYKIESLSPASLRFKNTSIQVDGEALELIGRLVQQNNKLTIYNASIIDAVFDVVIYYMAIL